MHIPIIRKGSYWPFLFQKFEEA
uniref:Uncharacterized protein n=1 Tax=Anguilla anguilla TaxID=7936 RepID=A0A0E9R036_ANGAN